MTGLLRMLGAISSAFCLMLAGLTAAPAAAAGPYPPNAFVSTWNTDYTNDESSSATQISLPLVDDGSYDFTVDWGDGSSSHITTWDQPERTHTYSTAGLYTLEITGTIKGWRFGDHGDRFKIQDIAQWGSLNFGNHGGAFQGAGRLTASATDTPDLTGVTNLQDTFQLARRFNGAVGNWDTSNVTNMGGMFADTQVFNQNLSGWNTSNVVNMRCMFCGAQVFNQNISGWDTSKVTNMSMMFMYSAFNQNIGGWNTSNVVDMSGMFAWNPAFSQDLGRWDIRNVTNMGRMFYWGRLETSTYDAILIGWARHTSLQHDVPFDAGESYYTVAGRASKARLVKTFNWHIHDRGQISSGGALTANPTQVPFGNERVGLTTPSSTVTVTNTGTGPLTFSTGAVTLTGDHPGQFLMGDDTCAGRALPPAGTCTVKVAFSPTSKGQRSAALLFDSDATDGPHTVTLTGTGIFARQTVRRVVKRLKVHEKVTLPERTRQGSPLAWKSATKKVCAVKGSKVTAKRKGTCRLTAKAPAITGYKAYKGRHRIVVR